MRVYEAALPAGQPRSWHDRLASRLVRVRFDRFYTYDELNETLDTWAKEFPKLISIESIGQSYEGRDIPIATVTNTETGPHDEKPAVIVHAQIHAMEFTGTTAALTLIDRLLHDSGSDEKVALAVDTRTFYVVPRVNPDGAEAGLKDGRFRRSSVRRYPYEEPQDGLHREDVDGDGRVLMMRQRDPNGAWKPHPDDPRLLIARRPDDVDGEFFRVFPEGMIQNWDGVTVKIAPVLEGLDLNRNWPADWAPEGDQRGAGPYPTSEPETRALVQAIVDRPNITSYLGYHTFSGVHLRPYSGRPDDDYPTFDLRAFKLMGDEATRLTDYPAISIFHDFKYDPKQVIRGGDVDWIYDFLGIYAWVTEFWSPQRAAGLSDYHFIDWIREHSPDDDLAILKLADEVGEGYVDWYPFEHPQLGPVELGGWDLVRFWFNPPLSRLEEEVERHPDFAVFLALVSPRLEIRSFESKPIGDGAFRLQLVLENAGWLPTNVTQKALDRKHVRPIEALLELPDGARVVAGDEREEAGQLSGRVERRAVLWWGIDHSTTDRTRIEWVVEAKAGERVGVVARHDRAGTARADVTL
jgi:murein tripeptide amidase MpaA